MKNRMAARVRVAFVAMLMTAAAISPAAAASVQSESPLSTAGVRKSEVSLGDLVADAVRSALEADIAFVSASELKERDAQIPEGKVSTQDVVAFITYTDDPLVGMRLTGKQIRQALERSVLIYPQKNLGFLQVSGLRFTFDPGKPQEGRVTSVRVGDGGAKPLAEDETYSVAMMRSLANGALGYWKIWSKSDIATPTQKTIPQAIDQFFSGRSTINYSTLNRITVGG